MSGVEFVPPSNAGVLFNDADPAMQPLSAVLVAGVEHGVLILNGDGSFTYTPTLGYSGGGQLHLPCRQREHAFGACHSDVRSRHEPPAQRPRRPVRVPCYQVSGGVIHVDGKGVLFNDRDMFPLTTLHAVLETDPAHGSISLNNDGSFDYTPQSGFHGTDTFTYRAQRDGLGDAQSDPAVASIVVYTVPPPLPGQQLTPVPGVPLPWLMGLAGLMGMGMWWGWRRQVRAS